MLNIPLNVTNSVVFRKKNFQRGISVICDNVL